MRHVLLAVVTVAAVVSACGSGGASAPAPSGPPPGFHAGTLEGELGGAAYRIEVPANWNGTLLLYSHGYVAPGASNPARDVTDPATGDWLLKHGYALAGSAFARTGWAVEDGIRDQVALLDLFAARVGRPRRTIAWGVSTGGTISAALAQVHPERLSGAVPLSGNLAGAVGRWNEYLDLSFALRTLLGASFDVAGIADADRDARTMLQAVAAAQQTPEGRARIALAAALGDEPGWFAPGTAEPAAADSPAREQNELLWLQQSAVNWMFSFRAELESRAGGNPSWNTGVDYRALLQRSVGGATARDLYQQAGLSLDGDLAMLERAPRIAADPVALAYLKRFIVYDGRLRVPVLTGHTTGDGQMLVQNEQAYADVVRSAGSSGMLRQAFVDRAGHVTFTPAEMIAAILAMTDRLDRGSWDAAAPGKLDSTAAALGPALNVIPARPPQVPDPVAGGPGFRAYQPPVFLRPFDARTRS